MKAPDRRSGMYRSVGMALYKCTYNNNYYYHHHYYYYYTSDMSKTTAKCVRWFHLEMCYFEKNENKSTNFAVEIEQTATELSLCWNRAVYRLPRPAY